MPSTRARRPNTPSTTRSVTRGRQRAHDVVETALRRGDRRPQFGDFQVVLDQAQLRERRGKRAVVGGVRADERHQRIVERAQHPPAAHRRQTVRYGSKFADRPRFDAEALGRARDAQPRADPQFAVRAVGEERGVGLAGVVDGVHDRAMLVALGHEHQHGIGFVDTGQVIEVGAGTKAIGRIVGADLFAAGRHHQHLAGELPADRAAARREALAAGQGRHGAARRRPRLRHEGEQVRRMAAVVRRAFGRLDHLHRTSLRREKTERPAPAACACKRGARPSAARG